MTALELADVRLRAGSTTILDGIDLSVGARELLAVVGPSGSGKTSALRVMLGLGAPDAGIVRIDGRVATDGRRIAIAPEARGIGVVFQDLALWPHLTVHGNLAFGLAELARDEREARIHDLLRRVDLADKARRYPGELSGGERQRVAIARALVLRPRVVALDEPLSNVDIVLAAELVELFAALLREANVATIYITHDPREAERLADRIAVMEAGRVVQSGTFAELRAHPATRFVERFVAT